MKTEKEVRDKIATLMKDYWHILNRYPASTFINLPVAMMQVEVRARLDTLYFVLGERRPELKCDDMKMLDH